MDDRHAEAQARVGARVGAKVAQLEAEDPQLTLPHLRGRVRDIAHTFSLIGMIR